MNGAAPAGTASEAASNAAARNAANRPFPAGALTRDSFTWGLVMELQEVVTRLLSRA